MRATELIAETDFKRRIEDVKEKIRSGAIVVQPQPEWTDALLQYVAVNAALLRISLEAKWN